MPLLTESPLSFWEILIEFVKIIFILFDLRMNNSYIYICQLGKKSNTERRVLNDLTFVAEVLFFENQFDFETSNEQTEKYRSMDTLIEIEKEKNWHWKVTNDSVTIVRSRFCAGQNRCLPALICGTWIKCIAVSISPVPRLFPVLQEVAAWLENTGMQNVITVPILDSACSLFCSIWANV